MPTASSVPKQGYAPSPLAYKDMVIAMVGGPGQGVMAFRQDDGQVVWRSGTFTDIANASPILINVQSQDQLVVISSDGVHAFDPDRGVPLWNRTFGIWHGSINTTPVWCEDDLLYISSAYESFREGIGGTHVLELTRPAGGLEVEVKELWWNRRVQAHFNNALRVDSFFVMSDGDFGPIFLTALDARTGAVLWSVRGFARANFLYADGKLIILDENGDLALATASREALTIHARAPVLTSVSRTAPTLVGTKLYLRDWANIVALELGVF